MGDLGGGVNGVGAMDSKMETHLQDTLFSPISTLQSIMS